MDCFNNSVAGCSRHSTVIYFFVIHSLRIMLTSFWFQSFTKLKEALRVCAAFRGTYLDFKDKADDRNAKNIAENAERL